MISRHTSFGVNTHIRHFEVCKLQIERKDGIILMLFKSRITYTASSDIIVIVVLSVLNRRQKNHAYSI